MFNKKMAGTFMLLLHVVLTCVMFKLHTNGKRVRSTKIVQLGNISSHWKCLFECSINDVCKSISYSKTIGGGQCRLHDVYIAEYMEMIVDESWNIYGITDPKPKVLILRNNISFETVTFDKNYTMFENGFGHVSFDNYWRGLKSLHKLTLKAFGVRFELTDFNNKLYWEEWNNITVGDVASGYRLHLSGRNTNSTLGNTPKEGMDHHNHMNFSTYDRDQDLVDINCATERQNVGWWYNACSYVWCITTYVNNINIHILMC